MFNLRDFLIKYYDILIYLYTTFIIISALISTYFHAYQLTITLSFCLFSAILYFLINKNELKESHYKEIKINMYLINLVFVLLFTISLVTLIMYNLPIFRPPIFFVFIALMYGIISIEILSTGKNVDRLKVTSVLIKCTVVSYLFNATFFIGVHSAGFDVLGHYLLVKHILYTGSSSTMPANPDTPIFHILWACISLIADLSPLDARFIMVAIDRLGILYIYILSKILLKDEKYALFSALIFSFLTLANRIRLQTEPLCFSIFTLLILYLFFSLNINRNIGKEIILILTYISLAYTHIYYSYLILIFLILVALLSRILFPSNKFLNTNLNLLIILFILWFTKIIYETGRLEWAVEAWIEMLTTPTGQHFRLHPAWAPITPIQFLYIHLSELLLVSLAIVGIFITLKKCNSNTSLIIVTLAFVNFSVLTVFTIIIEGGFKWDVNYRNFYLISLFLPIFGGLTLRRLELSVKKSYLIIPLLFILLSFFSVSSIQSNELDPIFHEGETVSPLFISYEEIYVLKNFILHTLHTYESVKVIGDTRTLVPANIGLALMTPSLIKTDIISPYILKTFSAPSLPELDDKDYEYLIVNRYSIEKGMILGKNNITLIKYSDLFATAEGVRGLKISEERLFNTIKGMSKVIRGKQIEVYLNESGYDKFIKRWRR